jgi:putative spermidine/putrescine transport system ATP-binding protein
VADFVGFENIFSVRDGKLRSETAEVPFQAALPAVAGLAFRPRSVALGAGPLSGTVRGVSFAGGTREYVLETAFGPIKAEADAGLPAHDLGATVAFDLPVERAARLERD